MSISTVVWEEKQVDNLDSFSKGYISKSFALNERKDHKENETTVNSDWGGRPGLVVMFQRSWVQIHSIRKQSHVHISEWSNFASINDHGVGRLQGKGLEPGQVLVGGDWTVHYPPNSYQGPTNNPWKFHWNWSIRSKDIQHFPPSTGRHTNESPLYNIRVRVRILHSDWSEWLQQHPIILHSRYLSALTNVQNELSSKSGENSFKRTEMIES